MEEILKNKNNKLKNVQELKKKENLVKITKTINKKNQEKDEENHGRCGEKTVRS